MDMMEEAVLRIDNVPASPIWWKNFRREIVRQMSPDEIVNNYIGIHLKKQYGATINSDARGRFLRFEDVRQVSVFLLRWS